MLINAISEVRFVQTGLPYNSRVPRPSVRKRT
ncbi:hypothetical protein SALBM311S_05655 [Streptomyces alboniger]